jgi:hypothetical protein
LSPAHLPPVVHLSLLVHASLSLQSTPVCTECWQPILGSQLSLVQGLLSSQLTILPPHLPPLQVSPVVHMLPSLQEYPACEILSPTARDAQTPLAQEEVSSAQALLLKQSEFVSHGVPSGLGPEVAVEVCVVAGSVPTTSSEPQPRMSRPAAIAATPAKKFKDFIAFSVARLARRSNFPQTNSHHVVRVNAGLSKITREPKLVNSQNYKKFRWAVNKKRPPTSELVSSSIDGFA